ncbi:hypothetical protein TRAPUB_13167 [Trametes pubescens]|uniref:Uncharacterized protein n=1 Tax=Trametes pubescens TaxID=154538 RepID=A0A1M2VRR0_TRAPU|nr:hypothetical protein TRAPUB_13167 [Trametes pubescens]
MAAVPFLVEEETVSPPESAAAPAPSLAPAQQQESSLPPRLRVSVLEPPQTSRASSVRSDSQAAPVSTSDHQELSTSNYALLSHEIDDFEGTPPPYYDARR